MKFIFIPYLLVALPFIAVATEPAKQTPTVSAIDMALSIHQQQKLHPELSDPVLGDRAAIVEWAWSPQYAKRFNLPVQPDGLKDGGLWLIGIKVVRQQHQDRQRYTCNIVGLLDSKLPILTPPGDRYMAHPSDIWVGGLPGKPQAGSADMASDVNESAWKNFSPSIQTWYKSPTTKRQETHPENSSPFTKYLHFHRSYQIDLAYFEIHQPCSYLGSPEKVRTELRFPTRIDGKNDDDPKVAAVFERSAVKFDVPDNLMRRIYPYTVEADDWSSCLMHRVSASSLTTHALLTKRFGNACDPVAKSQINR